MKREKILKINSYIPEWAIEYYIEYCKDNILSTEAMSNYTIECVRDIIYKWFEYVGKRKLTEQRKDKIAWLCYCNYQHNRYAKFIDLNFNKSMDELSKLIKR